jgi:diguanylate cyclase (GGDEF)-like protein/PAS domain S-box-containing protein
MEHSRPLSDRERRLYNIFARQMEKSLMYAKNVAERMKAESELRTIDIAERKRVQESLQNMTAKFHSLFEMSSEAIMLLDETGFFDCNEATLRLFGCITRDEFISKHPDDFSPITQPGGENSVTLENEHIATAVKFGSNQFEWVHRRMDGTEFSGDVLLTTLKLDGKTVLQARVRDISERKRMEASLRQLSLAVEQSPNSIVITDLDAKIDYVNEGFVKISGYSRAEVIGQNPRILQSHKTPQEIYRDMWGHLKRGEVWKGELTNRRKDGSECIESMLISPVRQADGQVTHYLAIKEDITERKKVETELRISATAFESQEGIHITDAHCATLRVNSSFTNITGYTAAEVIGKNPSLLGSGRHDAAFFTAMWESIQTTGTWKGEIYNRRKNGEIFPAYLSITAVKDKNGTVSNYVSTLTDITLKNEAVEKIKHLAFYDPLTGLPNRRLLNDRLQQAFAFSARSGHESALLFIDLDNFKDINDTLGHDIGDLLLQQAAQRLKSCMRESDTVARMGGDEFVVMLEELSEKPIEAATEAKAVGEKIIAALNQPYQLATHEYHCTASIGVTLFSDHHQSADDLLKRADIAMYQAKKAGRNTMRFFNPKMQEVIDSRSALESQLHKAIVNRQFHLYYQIQMDSSHHAIGAEALIRWEHPELGLVSPDQFIHLAEESGLIIDIGQWVLETACAQLKAWEQDALTRDLTLSVNVSAKQFHQADFIAQMQSLVQRHAINPTQLKLEITESMLLENVEEVIATMNALKKIGVMFSLDDFGTGYSSLQYLKRLPLDQLKIDQSFVRDIAIDNNDKTIVQTIIVMAQSLNLNVIAEGVETEEQRSLLLERGCTHYQGYLFSKPVPIEQFEALLKRG